MCTTLAQSDVQKMRKGNGETSGRNQYGFQHIYSRKMPGKDEYKTHNQDHNG